MFALAVLLLSSRYISSRKHFHFHWDKTGGTPAISFLDCCRLLRWPAELKPEKSLSPPVHLVASTSMTPAIPARVVAVAIPSVSLTIS